MGSDGGVVGGRVKALGTKGVPVQVGDATTLPNVLVAPIDFALLRRVEGIVVEGGVDGLTLYGVSTGPILRQGVLDHFAAKVLEKGYAIGGPNGIVVASGVRSGQCNWCEKKKGCVCVCVRTRKEK